MRAIVVVGHGAPPSDVPRDLVTRLKALEGRRRATGSPMSEEERTLDDQIRRWPRTPETDPYVGGVETLAAEVRRAAPGVEVVTAYNEFCAPSLEDAVTALVARGVREIDVVPTMFTQGGVHSEVEIPETLEALRAIHPEVVLRYAWPFDAAAVARLLVETVQKRR
jgi:sirohydrochlorin cobaltochelatase